MNNLQTNNWYKTIKTWIMLSMIMTLTLSATPVKIMFLGDSITEGDAVLPDVTDLNKSTYTGTNADANENGHVKNVDRIAYRGELWKLLIDANYTFANTDGDPELEDENATFDFVGRKFKNHSTFQTNNEGFDEHHAGFTGFTSKELLLGKDVNDSIDDTLDANIPDIVLLHIGTNDGGKLSINGTDSNSTVFNVEAILTKIFEANTNAKVFVARIIEARRAHGRAGGVVSATNPNGYWYTKDLNDAVAAMVATHANTDNIKMVNLESAAGMIYDPCGTNLGDMQPFNENNASNILYDYHPNANGYKKMAEKWFADMIASTWLPDITKPVIRLTGAPTVEVAFGATYTDAGATASDNVDGDITANITMVNLVNTNTAGIYSVTYDVNDTVGNPAIQVIRTVTVLPNPANQEKDWFTYEKATQTALVGPATAKSELKAEGVTVSPKVDADAITLVYTKAYIKAKSNGDVTTGFKDATSDKSTLKTNTFYAAGTKSIIKKIDDKVIIETSVTLAKDTSIVMGDK